MRRKGQISAEIIMGVILLGVIIFAFTFSVSRSEMVLIKEIEVKTFGDSQKYLVFTDKGVFERIEDNVPYGDRISEFEGKKIIIHYFGWRVPFLSWYPNIYSIRI